MEVLRSLVATVKFQPELDDSLEAKTVTLLKFVHPRTQSSADAFQHSLASSSDNSLTNLVPCILVLIPSPSHVITTSTMKILEKLMWTSSAKIRVALTKEDLVSQFITTLNPQSLSFTEAVESPNETSDEFQPTEKSINFGKCEIDRETPFVDEIRPDFCEAAAHEHSPATIIPS